MKKKRKSMVRWMTRFGTGLLLVCFSTPLAMVFFLKFIPPVTSAFMVRDAIQRWGTRKPPIQYHWVDWQKISPAAALAAVAAEDQKFPDHFGFDFQAIADAIEESDKGGRLRGASTISQQVAKNLFLWEGRSFLRKGLEACFTVLVETLWSKKRILEIYLNIAEFGDGIYGVKAASENFYGKPPADLTVKEAATLAAVLPSPKRYRADRPSAHVRQRAVRIENQMKNLGPSHLKDI
jgi:monofunctional biosynthetic peptidoglycan transglycosylase